MESGGYIIVLRQDYTLILQTYIVCNNSVSTSDNFNKNIAIRLQMEKLNNQRTYIHIINNQQ